MPAIVSKKMKEKLGTVNSTRENQKVEPSGVGMEVLLADYDVPDYMTQGAAKIFLATTEYLSVLHLLRPEDLPLVEQYSICVDQVRTLERKIVELNGDAFDSDKGKNYIKLKRGLARDALDFAKQIGISPSVRAKYKIELPKTPDSPSDANLD